MDPHIQAFIVQAFKALMDALKCSLQGVNHVLLSTKVLKFLWVNYHVIFFYTLID